MSGSKRGTQLFTVMQRGDLVPHEVVLDILAQKMVETVPGANGFLIDGFPLDMEEANAFEKQVVPVTRWDISSHIGAYFISTNMDIYYINILPRLVAAWQNSSPNHHKDAKFPLNKIKRSPKTLISKKLDN